MEKLTTFHAAKMYYDSAKDKTSLVFIPHYYFSKKLFKTFVKQKSLKKLHVSLFKYT